MANHNTLIIGIGKSMQVLTQVHHAEAVLGDEFPVPFVRTKPGEGLRMTLVDGNEEIPFELAGCSYQWPFNIWKLKTIMNQAMLKEWTFHHVPMFATRAGDVTAALVEAAKRGITLHDKP